MRSEAPKMRKKCGNAENMQKKCTALFLNGFIYLNRLQHFGISGVKTKIGEKRYIWFKKKHQKPTHNSEHFEYTAIYWKT